MIFPKAKAVRTASVFFGSLLISLGLWGQIVLQDSLDLEKPSTLIVQDTFVLVDLMTELKKEAEEADKLIALYFVTPNCPICKNMEEGTFTSNEVSQALADRYIFKELCALTNFDGLELAPKYSVQYYPTIVILSNKGRLLKKLEGYYGSEDLLRELRFKTKSN